MQESLESFEGYQHRSVERCHVLIETQLRVLGVVYPFEVLNISTMGFMGWSTPTLRIGAEVEVELPGLGFVDAQIRWALAGQVGVQFVQPLTPEACRHAILPDPPSSPIPTTAADRRQAPDQPRTSFATASSSPLTNPDSCLA